MRLEPPQHGWKPYRLVSANSNNLTSATTSPGCIGPIHVFNDGASSAFVKLYDKASAPVIASDTPKFVIGVGTKSNAPIPGDAVGLGFANGIALAIVGGLADTSTANVAANQVVVSFGYSATSP